MLNACSSVESVEIKPYSTNQANQQGVTHKDFEDHVIKWLESPINKKFDFINEARIIDSLEYIPYLEEHSNSEDMKEHIINLPVQPNKLPFI